MQCVVPRTKSQQVELAVLLTSLDSDTPQENGEMLEYLFDENVLDRNKCITHAFSNLKINATLFIRSQSIACTVTIDKIRTLSWCSNTNADLGNKFN